MKCPWCVAEGERSTIEPQGDSSYLMAYSPYYDEDGNYHDHNINNRGGGVLRCSRGHRFRGAFRGCASCGWGAHDAELIAVRCPGSGREVVVGPVTCPECGREFGQWCVQDVDGNRTYYVQQHDTRAGAEAPS